MRQLREILRLRLQGDLSVRQIHRSLRVSVGAVSNVVSKAREMKLTWQEITQLNDVQLACKFYPSDGSIVGNCNCGWDIVEYILPTTGVWSCLYGEVLDALPASQAFQNRWIGVYRLQGKLTGSCTSSSCVIICHVSSISWALLTTLETGPTLTRRLR